MLFDLLLFLTQKFFFENFYLKKKAQNRGHKKDQKIPKFLREFFKSQTLFFASLQHLITSQKKLTNFWSNKLNFSNFFVFLFLVGIYRCFWHKIVLLENFYFSKIPPPQKGGMKRSPKYQNFLGHFLSPKHYFLQAYNI